MEIFRKCDTVTTEAEALALLDAMDDFVDNAAPGKIPPALPGPLADIWNGGDRLEWEWEDETLLESVKRIQREEGEAAELEKLKSDNDYFKDVKIRPWRDQKLSEWIDQTFIQPLKFSLTSEQEIERVELRQELLDWPDLFDNYKTDDEIDDLKPGLPSWLDHN
jgi:hypothetical protein